MQHAVERVRGFNDLDPDAVARLSWALAELGESFARSGFRQMDVPIVEQLDLYLRKNGSAVLSKVYAFADQGKREVALRPEFTASVIRALAPHVDGGREPLRVAYRGPVFRYEKPQRATTRQFTQAGVEMLGDGSPAADAEIIALACRSARDLGVTSLRVVLGHLGPLRALLAHLGVDGHAVEYLLEHLEAYARGADGQRMVRQQLGLEGQAIEGDEATDPLPAGLASALQTATPEEARMLVGSILEQMGIELSGTTRTPDEIIDRVLAKARRQTAMHSGRRRETLERVLGVLAGLNALHGSANDVLAEARALLAEHDVPLDALDDISRFLERLADYDLAGVRVDLAPGMARGIAYYTGMIFELYAPYGEGPPAREALQICGGGRYDSLARALTGRSGFPALGFAFGVERLLHALPPAVPSRQVRSRVLVVAEGHATRRSAQRLADALRAEGTAAVVREAERDADRARDQARRAGYDAAVVVGAHDPNGNATGVCATIFRDHVALRAQLERVGALVAARAEAAR